MEVSKRNSGPFKREVTKRNRRCLLMAVVVQWLERTVVDNNFSLEKKSSWSQKKLRTSLEKKSSWSQRKLNLLPGGVGRFRETRVRFPPSAFLEKIGHK